VAYPNTAFNSGASPASADQSGGGVVQRHTTLPRNPLDRRYCARSPPGVPLTGAPPTPPPWATHTGTGGPLCQWSVWPYLQTLPRPLRLQLFEQQSAAVVQEEPDGKHPASVVVGAVVVELVDVVVGGRVVVVVVVEEAVTMGWKVASTMCQVSVVPKVRLPCCGPAAQDRMSSRSEEALPFRTSRT